MEPEPLKDGLSLDMPQLNIFSILDGGIDNIINGQEQQIECEDYYEFDDTVTPQNGISPNEQSFQTKYTLEGILGQGTNGIVYKCKHNKKDKIYAVKIMHIDEQKKSNLKKNFRIVRCLKHDNIVPYRALYLHRGQNTCYLVMEYCEYPCIDRKKTFSEDELKQIAKQILMVLKYFHQKSFWHRDIKPENILYDKTTKVVKVIDFGVGKRNQIDQGFKDVVHTITGTQSYRAPEMSTLNYNEKIDCWALGITLYELVAHCKPFKNLQEKSVGDFLKSNKLDFDQPQWQNYSQHLKDLIKRLLKISPVARISASQALKHPWLYDIEKNSAEEGPIIKNNKTQGKKWQYSQRQTSSNQRFFQSYNKKQELVEDTQKIDKDKPLFTPNFIDSSEEEIVDECF